MLMLACPCLSSRMYSTFAFMTICCIYQGIFSKKNEGMCSLNQFSSLQWNRSHALNNYTFADVKILVHSFSLEILDNKAILAGQCSSHTLIINLLKLFSDHIICKVFISINSRKSILQNHIGFCCYLFCFVFQYEVNLLCCTKMKVTGLFQTRQ